MILHTEPSLRIYFGDATNKLYPHEYLTWHRSLLGYEQFGCLAPLKLKNLFFLKQVHGVQGKVITHTSCDNPFGQDGDFLITHESRLGVGVVTADCVPVIAYDKRHHAVGIAHAGWRGALAGVVGAMINELKNSFNSNPDDLKIFLGPSAKKCCYRVDESFIQQIEQSYFGPNYIIKQDNSHYFDLPGFIVHQLRQQGIESNAICLDYNTCTIDNPAFWSYRRNSKSHNANDIGRQMTVVTLS